MYCTSLGCLPHATLMVHCGVLCPVGSSVATSSVNEGEDTSAGSHGRVHRQTNKEKEVSSRRSGVRRPSQDVVKESVVLAGKICSSLQAVTCLTVAEYLSTPVIINK